jgi:hypothetical protein
MAVPSKIDGWLAIVLVVAPAVSVAALIGTLAAGTGFVVALGSILLLAVVYLGLVFPMLYGIDDEHVIVRHGVVRQRIPLRDMSLDRLAIKFGESYFKSVMISPAAKGEFLDELARHANLRRASDRLVK